MYPQIYLIIDTELDWDNIVAAFDNKEAAQEFYNTYQGGPLMGKLAFTIVPLQSKFVKE